MKTRLFYILILIPTFISAQDWAPIGAKWTYNHDFGAPPYLTTIESVKDTTVLNKLCRLLITKETDEYMRPDGTYYWFTATISKDLIYTSNDTVFHYNKFDNSFYPLYLPNLKAHDTVLVREKVTNCTKNEYFCSRFEYIVDSISSTFLQGKALKLFYNTATKSSGWVFNRSGLFENYPILEKIGSTKFFFGVSINFVMEGGLRSLRCYQDHEISYKSDYWSGDCDYIRPLHGPLSILDFKTISQIVSPNPFDSFLKINIEKPTEYWLYDASGRLVKEGMEKEVNTELLINGLYLLKLKIDNSEIRTLKLVKYLL